MSIAPFVAFWWQVFQWLEARHFFMPIVSYTPEEGLSAAGKVTIFVGFWVLAAVGMLLVERATRRRRRALEAMTAAIDSISCKHGVRKWKKCRPCAEEAFPPKKVMEVVDEMAPYPPRPADGEPLFTGGGPNLLGHCKATASCVYGCRCACPGCWGMRAGEQRFPEPTPSPSLLSEIRAALERRGMIVQNLEEQWINNHHERTRDWTLRVRAVERTVPVPVPTFKNWVRHVGGLYKLEHEQGNHVTVSRDYTHLGKKYYVFLRENLEQAVPLEGERWETRLCDRHQLRGGYDWWKTVELNRPLQLPAEEFVRCGCLLPAL